MTIASIRARHLLTVILFSLAPLSLADAAENARLGIKGYDPVAYFTDGKPVEGKKELTAVHDHVLYRFASEANRDAFLAKPDAYAPQYRGWCAWAVGAKAQKAPVDPEVWKIVDGKLYLNYSKKIARKWEKDIPGFIAKGEVNWPKIRDVPPEDL